MLLRAQNVSFSRGRTPVLESVSLDVEAGRATALVGPNGSGKTTFIKIAASFLKPAAGTVDILGADRLGPKRRRRLGVVWQDRGLPLAISSKRWIGHLARLYGTTVDQELLETLGITPAKDPMRYLSGGEQQRIAIYGAFAHRPKLLLLDEPTVGLDDESRSTFYALTRERLRDGVGVLFTSHYSQDVAVLANSIVDLSGAPQETKIAALFNVNGILDVFVASSQLPTDYQLVATTNGYRLKGDDQATLLSVAMAIATAQNLEIVSFSVVGNA